MDSAHKQCWAITPLTGFNKMPYENKRLKKIFLRALFLLSAVKHDFICSNYLQLNGVKQNTVRWRAHATRQSSQSVKDGRTGAGNEFSAF